MEENTLEDILNPWNASSIFDFCYFCCPECDDKSKNKQDFVNHAIAYHSKALDTIQQISDGSLDDIHFPRSQYDILQIEIKQEKDDDKNVVDENIDHEIPKDVIGIHSVKDNNVELNVKPKLSECKEIKDEKLDTLLKNEIIEELTEKGYFKDKPLNIDSKLEIELLEESHDEDDFEFFTSLNNFNESDSDYSPTKSKSKKIKKKAIKEGSNSSENNNVVKDDAGQQKVKGKLGRPKRVKPDFKIDNKRLLPFIELNGDKDSRQRFVCSLCNQLYIEKKICVKHLNNYHQSEIISITTKSDYKPKTRMESYVCKDETCSEIYGPRWGDHFDLWCKQCTEKARIGFEKRRKKKHLKKTTPRQLCPECGVSIKDLKSHIERWHYGDKQICMHCGKDLRNKGSLKTHIEKVHEKLPCELCGYLVAKSAMSRHVQSKHTPNSQKKHKCDICGKGFVAKEQLRDHKHIHTGEKPYKCKYCSMCFASKGTHGMHQRTHLGHKRKNSKKKHSSEG